MVYRTYGIVYRPLSYSLSTHAMYKPFLGKFGGVYRLKREVYSLWGGIHWWLVYKLLLSCIVRLWLPMNASLYNIICTEPIWQNNWIDYVSDHLESKYLLLQFIGTLSKYTAKKLNFLAFEQYVTFHICIKSSLSTKSTKIGYEIEIILAGISALQKLGCRGICTG